MKGLSSTVICYTSKVRYAVCKPTIVTLFATMSTKESPTDVLEGLRRLCICSIILWIVLFVSIRGCWESHEAIIGITEV
jgi:hypothetical protein